MFGQGLFFEVGTRFSGENDGSQNSLLRLEKTFSFGQGLFFEVGTRFTGENDGSQNALLRLEKTFLFGQGLFFKVWTHFLGGNDRDQNSLIRFKIFFILSFYLGLDVDIHVSKKYSLVFTTEIIFYSSSLLGVFGARRDLNSKTKVKSSISKLLAWTL